MFKTIAGPRWLVLAAMLSLAGCGRIIPEGHPPGALPPPGPAAPGQPYAPAPLPPNAVALGVHRGPDPVSLGLTAANAAPALAAFREACGHLTGRADPSGLTQPIDWQAPCGAAKSWRADEADRFFTTFFESVVVGEGNANVTGYYEPEISGVKPRQPGFDVPIYGLPGDLVHARPGDAQVKPNGQTPFGRYDELGHFSPYYERAEIENGMLANRGLEIGWAADPVELFFLQIQGSGRLRAPDGSITRIGYAADNGRDYTSIGIILRDRGLIGSGPGQYPGSMQGIMQYLRDHPYEGRQLMDMNKSWVFFRELTGDGPIGALGAPVRGRVSLAADPLFTPLGTPVFLSLNPALAGATMANGLWVAEDTGGAIKGANRFDTFWGAGAEARQVAGGLIGHGQAVMLLPLGTLARLGNR